MLPNRHLAAIEPSKVRDYWLSPSHPIGRYKAAVFVALGYSQDNWHQLHDDLLALAHQNPAVAGQESPDEAAPRFLTAFPR